MKRKIIDFILMATPATMFLIEIFDKELGTILSIINAFIVVLMIEGVYRWS